MSSVKLNDTAANLTAGFIDLATYDELEKYMYGGADATTYFVRETRKSTWFTQCPVSLAKNGGVPEFGSEFSCSISRAGDYLLGCWLHVVTPQVTLKDAAKRKYAIAWTPNFMHALVKECCISFNDLVAARFDSAHLDFWSAFTTPADKAAGYSKMIGASLPSGGGSIAPQHLNLPLPFFFARDTGVALPTAALPYNEMRISFSLRRLEEMLCVFECDPNVQDGVDDFVKEIFRGDHQGSLVRKVPFDSSMVSVVPQLNNNHVQVWGNYAIVSNEERKRMACAPRDMLIEQVQSMKSDKWSQSYGAANNNNLGVSKLEEANLRFSHSVKALLFGARNLNSNCVHSNYTSGVVALGPQQNENVALAQEGQTRPSLTFSTNFGANLAKDDVLNFAKSGALAGASNADLAAGKYTLLASDVGVKTGGGGDRSDQDNTDVGTLTTAGVENVKAAFDKVMDAGATVDPTSDAVTMNVVNGSASTAGTAPTGLTVSGGTAQAPWCYHADPAACLGVQCLNPGNPLCRSELVYENTGRLGLMTMDYYGQVQPYYHAQSMPNDLLSPVFCAKGINMYSYSLDFMALDPMGSTNYGKLTNVSQRFETNGNLGMCGLAADSHGVGHKNAKALLALELNKANDEDVSSKYELLVSAVNNNIVRISGGALGFPVL